MPGDLSPGQVVAGSYKVVDFIGRGGMGAVYRVRHLFLDKDLALKTLTGSQVSEVIWRRFQQEGQAIARLDHTNIIRIYDLGLVNEKQPYYAMDLVKGMTLSDVLHAHGALTTAQALPIFRQVAAGLSYAHERGIIHRDLKPANIMLIFAEDQPIPTAKILDFGLAKLTAQSGENLTKTGEIFGSPFYMSPEQALGQLVDERTDIYSFGCALFEALTDEVPFKGKNALETMFMHTKKEAPRLGEKRPDLSFRPELENFVARLLAKSPSARIKNFNEVASQLLTLERSPLGAGAQNLDLSERARNDSRPQDESGNSQTYTNQSLSGSRALVNKPWFWPAAGLTMTAALIGIGAGCYSLFAPHVATNAVDFKTAAEIQNSASQGPKSDPQAKKNAMNAMNAMGAINAVNAINSPTGALAPYSKIIGSGPRAKRVFEFPSQSLGHIVYAFDEGIRRLKAVEWTREHGADNEVDNPYYNEFQARDKLEFNVRDALSFRPQGQTCATPFIFKKFRPDDFYSLALDYDPAVTSDFVTYIKHMTGLTAVSLKNTAVDAKCLPTLEKLPALHVLSVSTTGITGSDLAKSALLPRLIKLEFGHDKEISQLLKALAHSDKMEELLLNGDDLTAADLKILAHMPKLAAVKLEDCNIDDEDLKILAVSTSLKNLDLAENPITPKAMKTLAAMKLKQIMLSFVDWTPMQFDELQRKVNKDGRCEVKYGNRLKGSDL